MNEDELFDFESEYECDEDVENDLDNIITIISKIAADEDSETAIINPIKVRHVLYTYKLMRYMMSGSDAVVSYKLHKPYKTAGSVGVNARDISIRKPEWFMKAVELATNFEVYPKTDGTVQMTFTFLGLVNRL